MTEKLQKNLCHLGNCNVENVDKDHKSSFTLCMLLCTILWAYFAKPELAKLNYALISMELVFVSALQFYFLFGG